MKAIEHFDQSAALAAFRRELSERSDPVRAENEKHYLKSPFRFFGVPVPHINAMARAFRRAHPALGHKELLRLCAGLWASEYHQEKSLAIKLLAEYRAMIGPDDMPLIERMIAQCAGWDHADWLAIHVLGHIVSDCPQAFESLERWRASDALWLRRACLTSQIPLLRRDETERFFDYARGMLAEREFFIRKAIGWGIRELSKKHPEKAANFLKEIKALGASGLTMREGAKRLPEHLKRKALS